jgi:hypothetical protein
MSGSCAEWRGEIGGYIVGALHGQARARVGRHLVACRGCRAEYDDLVPVRAWLTQLPVADASPVTRPRGGPRREAMPGWAARADGAAGAARQPWWLRAFPVRGWRWLLAAGVALAAAGAAAALLLTGPAVGTFQAVNTASGISGRAELHSTPTGTEIDLTASGLPAGERCILVAEARGGADIAGTWNATYAGSARIAGTSAYPASQLTTLRIETDSGLILLSIRV